jgi:cytochrome c
MNNLSKAVGAAALTVMSCAAGAAGAGGDAVRGQSLYESRCTACHSVDHNRVGPAHAGVFGRKAGSAEGYGYSRALQSSKIVWGEVTLDGWLRNPEATVPGQKMGYSVGEAQDRADLIAYLKTLQRP